MTSSALVRFVALGVALILPACATQTPLAPQPVSTCETGATRLTQDFSTAPDYACERAGEAAFALTVTPEDPDINPSPGMRSTCMRKP